MSNDNYLYEDNEMVSEQLERLHRACVLLLNDSIKGDFNNNHIETINIIIRRLKLARERKLMKDKFDRENMKLYEKNGWVRDNEQSNRRTKV